MVVEDAEKPDLSEFGISYAEFARTEPYYLKIEAKKGGKMWSDAQALFTAYANAVMSGNIPGETHQWEIFGRFSKVNIFSPRGWRVYEFTPYSRDQGDEKSVYATRNLALAAALEFLDEQWFIAKEFPLEKYIDGI